MANSKLKGTALNNPIPGSGTPGGIAVVLDMPSDQARWRRTHLTGQAQAVLEQTLRAIDPDHPPLYYTYAFPFGGMDRKKVSGTDLQRARPRLFFELAEVRPQKILACGNLAYDVLNMSEKTSNVYKVRGLGTTVFHGVEGGVVPTFCVATIPPFFLRNGPERFRDFTADLTKLLEHDAPHPFPNITQVVVQDVGELIDELDYIRDASIISCDTETTGLNVAYAQIETIGIGAYLGGNDYYTLIIPIELIDLEDTKLVLLDFFRRFPGRVAMHNATFDISMLSAWFGEQYPHQDTTCTMLRHYQFDERAVNSFVSPHGLKTIARVLFDRPDYHFDWKKWNTTPNAERNWAEHHAYLSEDLCWTYQLDQHLLEQVFEAGPDELADLQYIHRTFFAPGVHIFAEIKNHGALLDIPYLESLDATMAVQIDEAAKEAKLAMNQMGVPVKVTQGLNMNSPKQMQTILYGRMNLPPQSAKRSTDKPTLLTLRFKFKGNAQICAVLDAILLYRGLSKAYSTYVVSLREMAGPDGRIHGSLNQAGTSTGRLSGQDPNLQNIPQVAGPTIRRAFIAPPGFQFMEADYKQLELRVAAHISGDRRMIQAFIDERDIHTEVASTMFLLPPEEITKSQRHTAKFFDFGIMYGRGPASMATDPQMLPYGWTTPQAAQFIQNYLSQFPDLSEWMEEQKAKVLRDQALRTPLGRRRRWPLLNESSSASAQREALNFPIQSLASDITIYSMFNIHRELQKQKARSHVIFTVHDSVDLEVADDELDDVCRMCVDLMQNKLPMELDVPLTIDIEVGPNWGDAKKYTGYL